MSKKALVLFAHGARDPRWAAPFQRLQAMTQASSPETTVALAFLEFMTIFLGQGGHVLRDLPILLDELRGKYPQLSLTLEQAVGEEESVLHAIRDVCLRAVTN
jgi:sirohydrochlorin cobaltochelatase